MGRNDDEDRDYRAMLEELVEKIKTVPLSELPVVGKDKYEGHNNLIVLDGKGQRLMVQGLVDADVGENVWVNAGMMVVNKTGRRAIGQVASVNRIDDGRILIGFSNAERWVPYDKTKWTPKVGWKASVLGDWTVIDLWEEPNRSLIAERPSVRYKDVAGLSPVVRELREAIEMPHKHKESFEALGIRRSGGVLLHGPPGVGKTLIAKATAGENDMAFFSVKVSDILNKYVGESENRIAELFQQARDNAPSIIFFDEFDSLGQTRNDGETARVYSALVAQFLSEMDGLAERGEVFIMAATNRPEMVDPAFMRPGRFDKVIGIPRPDAEACYAIASLYLPNSLPFGDDMKTVRRAVVSSIFDNKIRASGALVEGICNESKVACVLRCGERTPKLTVEDVEAGAKRVLRAKATATSTPLVSEA